MFFLLFPYSLHIWKEFFIQVLTHFLCILCNNLLNLVTRLYWFFWLFFCLFLFLFLFFVFVMHFGTARDHLHPQKWTLRQIPSQVVYLGARKTSVGEWGSEPGRADLRWEPCCHAASHGSPQEHSPAATTLGVSVKHTSQSLSSVGGRELHCLNTGYLQSQSEEAHSCSPAHRPCGTAGQQQSRGYSFRKAEQERRCKLAGRGVLSREHGLGTDRGCYAFPHSPPPPVSNARGSPEWGPCWLCFWSGSWQNQAR